MICTNYIHQTVYHTGNFVDPTAEAHTQTMESFWPVYKVQNKRQYGTHAGLLWTATCVRSFGGRCNEIRTFSSIFLKKCPNLTLVATHGLRE